MIQKNIQYIMIFGMLFTIIACTKNEEIKPITAPKFTITPNNTDFGVVQNNTSSQQEFVIVNEGNGELKLINFTLEGANSNEFSTNAINNTSVKAGKFYKFTVSFTPKNTGNKIATLKIIHNIGNNSITLKGRSFSEDEINTIQDAWIFFKDKPNKAHFLSSPTQMLSAKSLERRNKQGIDLDTKDVPIEESYYNKVKSTSGVTILAKSKWLNALHIQASQATIEILKSNNNFISKIEYADKSLNIKNRPFEIQNSDNPKNKFEKTINNFNYGTASTQIQMLKTDVLHQKGFTGNGVTIAIIDAGFPNVNTLKAFKRLRDNNKILGGYNFVERTPHFYSGNSHGTHVLSTIGGYVQDSETSFVGTAPDASFYLFITEDENNEVPLEESLWVEAVEKADSLGVDIINTSLGYFHFDNPKYNYTYSDLNGETTFITRGAEIATSKGMILVNSAGNEGHSTWKYVTPPADAKSVLTVGAVTGTKSIVNFSSRGPTIDGRIKPDIMAQGFLSAVINFELGSPAIANGTSFSSPIIAGSVACLLQAYPNEKSLEIIEEIKKGSDKYGTPDNDYGYGIPNFEQIFENLK